MSTSSATLDGFAYGEDLEGLPPRSLGYRLLAPLAPEPWCAEVEALARRLQGAPYPDHWPPTDLFCSVLLADGRRLIAVARYGLVDHTPSQRRGGLELIGAVAPGDLDVPSALAVYRWLRARRAQSEEPHALGGSHALADVLSAAAPPPAPSDPVPVLPIRLWQEGALLFAATAPSDPDHRLGLLEQGAGRGWQWLPLVGPDFPLPAYARRGPLVAWAPHLAGVAVKMDRKEPEAPAAPAPWQRRVLVASFAGLLLLLGLTAANLWAALALSSRLAGAPQPAPGPRPEATARQAQATHPAAPPDESRERFAEALHDLLLERLGSREWEQGKPHFLDEYKRLAKDRPDLRLKESNTKGRAALGAVVVLSGRGADRVAEVVKAALSNKGYEKNVIDAAAERARQQLLDDLKGP